MQFCRVSNTLNRSATVTRTPHRKQLNTHGVDSCFGLSQRVDERVCHWCAAASTSGGGRGCRTCHCKNTQDSAALAFDPRGTACTKEGPGRRASSRDTHSHIKTGTTRWRLGFFFLQFAFARPNKTLASAKEAHKAVS